MTGLRHSILDCMNALLAWFRSPAGDELWPDEHMMLWNIEDKLAKIVPPHVLQEREQAQTERTTLLQRTARGGRKTWFGSSLETVGRRWRMVGAGPVIWGVSAEQLIVHARYLCALADSLVERGVAMPADVAEVYEALRGDVVEADSTRRLGGGV